MSKVVSFPIRQPKIVFEYTVTFTMREGPVLEIACDPGEMPAKVLAEHFYAAAEAFHKLDIANDLV